MEVGILGPVQALRDGGPLLLGGPQQRALLALLALDPGRPVSRDRLIDGLWGERPPPSANATLDSAVSRLRRVLGSERILRRPPGYLLAVPPDAVDATRFEAAVARAHGLADPEQRAAALDAALALWRGPALADLLFAPFAAGAAGRLEEARLLALEARADAALAAGAGASLVPDLATLTAEHPLRERLVAQHARALYRAGRQADALAAITAARGRMVETLGLEPGPELRALERGILTHDPALAAPAPPPRPGRAAEASRRPVRRRAALAGLAVAVAVAVVTLTGPGRGDSASVPADARRDAVVAIAGGRVTATATLPGSPAALVAAAGSLWAADPGDQVVLRIDPASARVVDRVPLGSPPSLLASADGAVWAADAVGGPLRRIDPATDTVTQTVSLGGVVVRAMAARGDRVWVADGSDARLVVVDARSGREVARPRVGTDVAAVAVGAGAVWAAGTTSDAGALLRVDAATGRVTRRIPVGDGPSDIAVAGGDVWVANSLDATVSRVDIRRGRVTATVGVPGGAGALATAGGALWVAGADGGVLARVDRRAARVSGTVATGGRPAGVAALGDRVWAGVGASPASHRGGTLRLVATEPQPTIDPQLAFTALPLQFTRLAYDGLVGYAVAPGAGGLQLVPDLALALPQPADGGRVYAFRLRPGLRYADGRPVRAGDFRRGVERLFRIGSTGASEYGGLVGAERCAGRPAACSLPTGVVTDDRAGTVVFRLRTADPDFLPKLTVLGYGVPIPPGTPDRDVGTRPVPGTGPYRIVRSGDGTVRFGRNPRFREWSHAAQPAGNPDAIEWRTVPGDDAAARAVETGRDDWLLGLVDPARIGAITRTRAAQVHSGLQFLWDYIPLNTHRRPFDDVRVRRALDLALDRRHIAALYGGAPVATPLCQSILPGMLGHRRRACPRPDLRRARALVRAAGRRGAPVDVLGIADQLGVPRSVPRYVTTVLRAIGLRARLRVRPADRVTQARRRRLQISVDGDWVADYPRPSATLPQFLGCDGGTSNGYVCDRGLEHAFARARAAQVRDDGSAGAAWAAADRRISERALWIPTVRLREPELVSARARNVQFHPLWDLIADQVWLR